MPAAWSWRVRRPTMKPAVIIEAVVMKKGQGAVGARARESHD